MNKEKIIYEVKENFVDATSVVTLTMPLNASIELFGAKMTNQVSLNSRFYNLILAYAGITRVVKIRDYTKKKFNIAKKSWPVKAAHDLAYGLALGPIIRGGIYLGVGETDLKKITIGVLGSMGVVGGLSVPMGWAIDVGRDLWGLKPSERTPKYFENKSAGFKKDFVQVH
jgi:hypothetical protein